jgi:hypothetical protein
VLIFASMLLFYCILNFGFVFALAGLLPWHICNQELHRKCCDCRSDADDNDAFGESTIGPSKYFLCKGEALILLLVLPYTAHSFQACP